MGRCIDADKVIEDLEKVKKESVSLGEIVHIIGFQSVIEAQPTVCDTNKIVEQLEDIHLALEKAKKEMLIDYVYNADENIIALIRLLKGGGVNA